VYKLTGRMYGETCKVVDAFECTRRLARYCVSDIYGRPLQLNLRSRLVISKQHPGRVTHTRFLLDDIAVTLLWTLHRLNTFARLAFLFEMCERS